jgi:hypothetical protein
MFEPTNAASYHLLDPDKQILVCSLDNPRDAPHLCDKWDGRACAIFAFPADGSLAELVRDLLWNPQLRIIVLDGEGPGAQVIRDFWASTDVPKWGIPSEHITLVRQFVNLYDEDCGSRWLQPFWPKRLKYTAPPP